MDSGVNATSPGASRGNTMSDHSLVLSDGRCLSYRLEGVDGGVPVFMFHGIPGSRLCGEGMSDDPLIHEFGVPVVLPDRPGMGYSHDHPGRSFKSWADDVAAVADCLGIERFHVAGGSGGGPHALACGVYLGSRILSISVIAGAAPPELPGLSRGMARGNRLVFLLARRIPSVLGWSFKSYAQQLERDPQRLVRAIKTQLCDWDLRVLNARSAESDPMRLSIADLQEAFRQGHDGVLRDFLLVGRPWDLNFGAIRARVFLWHGESDTLMPFRPVRTLAKALPRCRAHFLPDAGHLLLEDSSVGRRILECICSADSEAPRP